MAWASARRLGAVRASGQRGGNAYCPRSGWGGGGALLDGSEHVVESHRVLELVRSSDCSAYDCEFIALAHTLGTQLVTMDGKLLKAFQNIARPLVAG